MSVDGRLLDSSAPAVTMPASIWSPFDSRNSVFGRDAFFSLLVFTPMAATAASDEDYAVRSVLAQTVLALTAAGNTKFSVAKTPNK